MIFLLFANGYASNGYSAKADHTENDDHSGETALLLSGSRQITVKALMYHIGFNCAALTGTATLFGIGAAAGLLRVLLRGLHVPSALANAFGGINIVIFQHGIGLTGVIDVMLSHIVGDDRYASHARIIMIFAIRTVRGVTILTNSSLQAGRLTAGAVDQNNVAAGLALFTMLTVVNAIVLYDQIGAGADITALRADTLVPNVVLFYKHRVTLCGLLARIFHIVRGCIIGIVKILRELKVCKALFFVVLGRIKLTVRSRASRANSLYKTGCRAFVAVAISQSFVFALITGCRVLVVLIVCILIVGDGDLGVLTNNIAALSHTFAIFNIPIVVVCIDLAKHKLTDLTFSASNAGRFLAVLADSASAFLIHVSTSGAGGFMHPNALYGSIAEGLQRGLTIHMVASGGTDLTFALANVRIIHLPGVCTVVNEQLVTSLTGDVMGIGIGVFHSGHLTVVLTFVAALFNLANTVDPGVSYLFYKGRTTAALGRITSSGVTVCFDRPGLVNVVVFILQTICPLTGFANCLCYTSGGSARAVACLFGVFPATIFTIGLVSVVVIAPLHPGVFFSILMSALVLTIGTFTGLIPVVRLFALYDIMADLAPFLVILFINGDFLVFYVRALIFTITRTLAVFIPYMIFTCFLDLTADLTIQAVSQAAVQGGVGRFYLTFIFTGRTNTVLIVPNVSARCFINFLVTAVYGTDLLVSVCIGHPSVGIDVIGRILLVVLQLTGFANRLCHTGRGSARTVAFLGGILPLTLITNILVVIVGVVPFHPGNLVGFLVLALIFTDRTNAA